MVQTTNNRTTTQTDKKLSIQILLDGFSFCIQDFHSKEVLDHKHIAFSQKVSPNRLIEEIGSIYEEHTQLKSSFKQVTVVYANNLYTLVPSALFDENNLADYLKFNTRLLKTDFLTYDSLPALDLVNVYIPYTSVNNFFFDQYGSFDFLHALTVILDKHVLSYTGLTPKILINIYSSSFDILVLKEGKLLLANSFDYITKEDFIYYLLFTVEQLNLDPENVLMEMAGHITKESDLYKLAYTYIREVSILEGDTKNIPKEDYLLSTLA